jgi:hypothetical protein
MSSVPRLGEQLVLRKVITPQQLEKALEMQQNDGGRLGSILIRICIKTGRRGVLL